WSVTGVQTCALPICIVDDDEKARLENELKEMREKKAREAQKPKATPEVEAKRSSQVEIASSPPKAPDFDQHTLTNTPLEHIWSRSEERRVGKECRSR